MARTKQQQTPDKDLVYYYPQDIPFEDSDNNPKCCLNPSYFYERNCHECRYCKNCVYENKYHYERLSLK
jgi:hypothetical protein